MVTTPDRPKGRGLKVQPNPVGALCEEKKILTLKPASLRDPEAPKEIHSLSPDLFLVASYGKLIPAGWLRIPKVGSWNLHPSLLPKYRGAAPIPRQILAGEKETGVTVALLTEALDAGDIVHQIKVPLEERDTAESLALCLAETAKRAFEEALDRGSQGRLRCLPQDESQSSYAKKLAKEEGRIDLTESAVELERKIRAFHPWPGAFVGFQKEPLRMAEAAVDSIACAEAKPGTLLEVHPQGFLRIQTGEGSLKVFKVQLPGRRVVTGKEFANGRHLAAGFCFERLT